MKSCKKGYYYCFTDEKCKKVPRGWHVMSSGYLARDKDDDENENENGNGGGNGDGGGVSEELEVNGTNTSNNENQLIEDPDDSPYRSKYASFDTFVRKASRLQGRDKIEALKKAGKIRPKNQEKKSDCSHTKKGKKCSIHGLEECPNTKK